MKENTTKDIDVYSKDTTVIERPESYNNGVKVGWTAPAKWWNWLFNACTIRLKELFNTTTSIHNEIKNAVGGTLDPESDTQLKDKLEKMKKDLEAMTAQVSANLAALEATKAKPNGIASLDPDGRIPYSQLPESAMEFKGDWDASTNTPVLADGTGDLGDMYLVSVGGAVDLGSGSITFLDGDRVIYNQAGKWEKISGGSVKSVNTARPDATGNVNVVVDSNHIAPNAVTETKIADRAVTVEKIANAAVTNAKIISGSITDAKIAPNAVTTTKIADGAVAAAKLATNAVTAAKIADEAVTTTKLGVRAVTAARIADEAITAAKIADEAVTTTKLGVRAVTAARIADGAVTDAKIAANAVTSAKIASGAVTAAKCKSGSNLYMHHVEFRINNTVGDEKHVLYVTVNVIGQSANKFNEQELFTACSLAQELSCTGYIRITSLTVNKAVPIVAFYVNKGSTDYTASYIDSKKVGESYVSSETFKGSSATINSQSVLAIITA